MPLLACRAAAFLPCSRQGLWPLHFLSLLFGAAPLCAVGQLSRSCFLLVAGFGHTRLLLLWAAPLCAIGVSCCFPLLSSAWPCWPVLLPRDTSSGRASVHLWPVVLLFVGPRTPVAPPASPAAFMFCPLRGLWPFLRVPLGPRLRVNFCLS